MKLAALIIAIAAPCLGNNSPRPAWTEQVVANGQALVVSQWTNLNAGHSWVLQTAPTMAGEWRSVSQHWGAAVTIVRPTTGTTEFWRLTAGP